MARHKTLFVDDDPEILAAYKRAFRKKFLVDTAEGPIRGLEAVAENGPYAVVVSDLRMPAMDGIEFFSNLRKTCPDTVRIMLTGYADIKAAISAVNSGNVFRFLAKPCPESDVEEAVKAGLAQYALVTAEKEFLKGTLRGVIMALTGLLALFNPEAHGRSSRVKRLVLEMGRYFEYPDPWRLELAVMLSQIGCAVMPESMLIALRKEGDLDPLRRRLFEMHPQLASDLLGNIPKLGEIAETVLYQEKRFNGGGPPGDDRSGVDIPLGSRLLKVCLDYDGLTCQGKTKAQAIEIMKARKGWYDPKAVQVLDSLAAAREGFVREERSPADLEPGMILDQDVPAGPPGAGDILHKGMELDEETAILLREAQAPAIAVLVPVEDNVALGRLGADLTALLKKAKTM